MRSFPLAIFVTLVSGYVLWSLVFIALYAGHGLVCIVMPGSAQTAMVGVWGGAIALHAVLALWLARTNVLDRNSVSPFVRRCAIGLAMASLAAAIGVGLPILFLASCA